MTIHVWVQEMVNNNALPYDDVACICLAPLTVL